MSSPRTPHIHAGPCSWVRLDVQAAEESRREAQDGPRILPPSSPADSTPAPECREPTTRQGPPSKEPGPWGGGSLPGQATLFPVVLALQGAVCLPCVLLRGKTDTGERSGDTAGSLSSVPVGSQCSFLSRKNSREQGPRLKSASQYGGHH